MYIQQQSGVTLSHRSPPWIFWRKYDEVGTAVHQEFSPLESLEAAAQAVQMSVLNGPRVSCSHERFQAQIRQQLWFTRVRACCCRRVCLKDNVCSADRELDR